MGFFNKCRGLSISGTGFSYLSEGAYGVVFVDPAATSVIKVYNSRPNLDDHVRAVFNAEIDAYCIAASSPAISHLVPGNFQRYTIKNVEDNGRQDVTGEFFPDFAFKADFIRGDFYKI